MKHRFTLTLQTRAVVTTKEARDQILDALTSGGLREIDVKLTKIPKSARRKRDISESEGTHNRQPK